MSKKKLLGIGLLSICLLTLSFLTAKADLIQNSGSTNVGSSYSWAQFLGTGITGTFTTIKAGYTAYSNGDLGLRECNHDPEQNLINTGYYFYTLPGLTLDCNYVGGFESGTVNRDGTWMWKTGSYSANSNKWYVILNTSTGNYFIGDTVNDYGYGRAYSVPAGVLDMKFQAIGVTNYTAPSVSIDYPTATSTADFSTFKLSFSMGSEAPAQYFKYDVAWQAGTSTDIWNTSVSNLDYQYEIFPSATSSVSLTNVSKSFQLVPGVTYYAQAHLLDATSTAGPYSVIATSSVISFSSATYTTIDNFYTGFNETFGTTTATTSTSTSDTLTCGSNLLCKLFVYLFVPPNIDMTNFYNNLKSKVPFGYVTLIINKINDSFADVDTASSSPLLTFQTKLGFEQNNATTATMTIPVLNFSDASTSAIFGSSPFSTFKTLIQYGLYISFVVYLFFRGKSIL